MTKLGRYTVESELGRGSMGVVYLAHDPQIRRRVAVKTISLPGGLSEQQKSDFRARFLREAQAAGSLTHPGIVTIYGVEDISDQELPFITMEYVAGRNLQHILQTEGRLVPERAFQMAMSLAEALQTAHAAGVIHRDIKPANVLVRDKDGAVKITDFGVARVPMGDLTQGDGILGSPSYMAPEQIKSGESDGRSDLFALAVILYEALTGERLHSGDDLVTIAEKVANRPVPSVVARIRGLPASTDAFFQRALAKDPADRFPNAAAFREAINELLLEMELDLLSSASTPDMPFVVADTDAFARPKSHGRRYDPRILAAAAAAGVVLFMLAVLGIARMVTGDGSGTQPVEPARPATAPVRQAEAPSQGGTSAAAMAYEPGAPEPAIDAPVEPAQDRAVREAAAAVEKPVVAPKPETTPAPRRTSPPAAEKPAAQPTPTPTETAAQPDTGEADGAPVAGTPLVSDPTETLPVEPALAEVAVLPDTGSLLLAVTSKIKSGTLRVFVDGEEIYSRELEATGKKFNRLLKKVTQKAHEAVEEAIEIPAGAHTVTARLQIAGKAAVSEASVDIDLAAGTTRTVEIVAGRKFGFGDALNIRLGD